MEPSNDDHLKWFGEGFDGFPRHIPENRILYSIFLRQNPKNVNVSDQLEKICSAARDLTTKLLQTYIWQQEGFSLQLVRERDLEFLRGATTFGDSIEDEWVVVYLLRELSKQFQDAWIRAVDTDGEFFLIEAADVLPKWLSPENSENRVWMNRGRILLIAPTEEDLLKPSVAGTSKGLTIDEALPLLHIRTLYHNQLLEEEAFRRLQDYPGRIKTNQHHAMLKIPRRLAFVLREYPTTIGPAIDAVYLRDPIALRTLKVSNVERLAFPASDLVTMRTKFNKVGFAQLKSQQLDLPQAWAKADSTSDSRVKAQIEMGMKLTSGFEMLLSDPQNRSPVAIRDIKELLLAVECGRRSLPTNSEVAEMGAAGDDESWMDINYEDLEKELSGYGKGNRPTGFGDKYAQDNLRRMAARLETLLNTDATASDDDDLDSSRSLDETDGPECRGEDKDASFDEDELTAMMRDMMGLPQDVMKELMGSAAMGPQPSKARHASEPGEPSADAISIQELTAAMEVELREAGALRADSPSTINNQRPGSRPMGSC